MNPLLCAPPSRRPYLRPAEPLAATLVAALTLSLAPCQVPGVTLYGTPTPGCAGTATIGATSSPVLGNSAFAITCQNGFPLAPTLLILSAAQQVPPVQVGNANVWVNTHVAAVFFVTMSLGGAASFTQPIPNVPSLVGSSWYAQYGWTEPGPTCIAGTTLLGATQAMQFTIQQCGSEPGEPNETLAQATPITAPTTLTRLLCPSGDADWYSFTNTGQSVANITMTPPSGRNYDLSLQSAGGVIAVSAASGSTPESISTCLGAGTFYIVVTGAGGASDPFATYSLSLSLTTPSPPPPQTTSSGPIQMASGNWHPVLQNFNFVGPNGPCTRTVQITISGSHTVTCTSPTAAIKWYDLSLPFPQTLASTTLTAAGTYSVTASFTAQPGHSYGFGLYVSGQTPTCPVTVGGTMTVR